MSLHLVSTLAPIRVQTVNEEPVVLRSLWKKQPVVLVFVRHFG